MNSDLWNKNSSGIKLYSAGELVLEYFQAFICDALRNLVPFLQFQKVENTHGWVLLSVLKVTPLHACFSCFLIRKNGTKSRKASQIMIIIIMKLTITYISIYLFHATDLFLHPLKQKTSGFLFLGGIEREQYHLVSW